MFKKLVAIEPVSLIPTAEEALHQYAEQVELYRDIPADDEEIVRRIGDEMCIRDSSSVGSVENQILLQ